MISYHKDTASVNEKLYFLKNIQNMMGNSHHIPSFTDREMVFQIQLKEIFFHLINDGTHIVGDHIRAYIVKPLNRKIFHQAVDIFRAVKL